MHRRRRVSPDTPLDEVARLMIERQVHHVIVNGGERIVGVASSFDFVRSCVRS
jgi:CBS domain-containing protein